MAHGGKRRGAGRPKGQGKFGEATKPVRLPVTMIKSILNYINNKAYKIPLYSSKVPAGSPSPADDHMEDYLDLNEHLIKHPTDTFFVRATGDSMINANIHENDILIIDRSIMPSHGKIVIAVIDGQLTVKRMHLKNGKLLLMPENPDFTPFEVKEENEIHIWGVVTNVIHSMS